jgi:hypothetical protein
LAKVAMLIRHHEVQDQRENEIGNDNFHDSAPQTDICPHLIIFESLAQGSTN